MFSQMVPFTLLIFILLIFYEERYRLGTVIVSVRCFDYCVNWDLKQYAFAIFQVSALLVYL